MQEKLQESLYLNFFGVFCALLIKPSIAFKLE